MNFKEVSRNTSLDWHVLSILIVLRSLFSFSIKGRDFRSQADEAFWLYDLTRHYCRAIWACCFLNQKMKLSRLATEGFHLSLALFLKVKNP